MQCAIDDTIEYVKHLARQMVGCSPDCVILVVLMKLGIPTTHMGFEFLKTAVFLRYEDPLRTLTNDIYPALRKRYGLYITDEQFESAIRTAIQQGWKRIGLPTWRTCFPTILYENRKGKPSNAEFIDELARIVELWCGCAEAYARQGYREEVIVYGKKE